MKLTVPQGWLLLAANTPQGADNASFPSRTIESLKKKGLLALRCREMIRGFDRGRSKFVAIYVLTDKGRQALKDSGLISSN